MGAVPGRAAEGAEPAPPRRGLQGWAGSRGTAPGTEGEVEG